MKKFGMLSSRGVALFASASVLALAAGGGAVAGSLITSKDIQDKTIRGADIHKNAVKTQKVKDGTLRIGDLNAKAREALKKVGPAGPAGPKGPQGPQGPVGSSPITTVANLTGAWKARAGDEAGVKLTGDGVRFGPFANGGGCATAGTDFARLDFSGLNGQPLSALKNLAYYARYTSAGDTSGVGAPVIRVFFEGHGIGGDGVDEPNRLTFSPNTQTPDGDFAEGPFHEWVVTSGSVRYNDDSGSAPGDEAPWSSFMAAHGSKKIQNINILNGCQAGTDLTSLVRWVEANGTTYAFRG